MLIETPSGRRERNGRPVRNVLVYTLPQMNINNNFKFYKNAKTEDKFRRKEEIHVHRYW